MMPTVIDWLSADWPAPEGVVAGCSCRSGGVSEGPFTSLNLGDHVGDNAKDVQENRRRFSRGCRLPAEPVWLNQVHGTAVVVDPATAEVPQADAILTSRTNSVCAVLTADCVPVVFAADDGTQVGVAHAGWRGLCAGVLEATVAEFAQPPSAVLAWLGPAISQAAFEVGAEVRAEFVRHNEQAGTCFRPNGRGRWQADLYALARLRLAQAGVERVFGGEYCTFGEPERFFSYRRDGQCGRMASFVFRTT